MTDIGGVFLVLIPTAPIVSQLRSAKPRLAQASSDKCLVPNIEVEILGIGVYEVCLSTIFVRWIYLLVSSMLQPSLYRSGDYGESKTISRKLFN